MSRLLLGLLAAFGAAGFYSAGIALQALEARLEEIGVALADPALYVDGERARAIAGERKTAEEQMAWLMREWEALSTALAGHD